MREFARLFEALDQTTSTNEKVDFITEFLRRAEPSNASWAMFFLMGRRLKAPVKRALMKQWAIEASGLPEWLFDESYGAVADLAETLTLIVPAGDGSAGDRSLSDWVTATVLKLPSMALEEQKETLLTAWAGLSMSERFIFNKLLTGNLRVGVSGLLAIRALAAASGRSVSLLSRRLMGDWEPSEQFFRDLASEEGADADLGQPYPFALAHAIKDDPSTLGEPGDWIAEWKWDGIRCQAIHRSGQTTLWSRGEGLIAGAFPEIEVMTASWPDGAVVDGEILAWDGVRPLPFAQLQRRLNRKNPGKKLLEEVPCRLIGFDLLEWDGEDLRERSTLDRRILLEKAALPGLIVAERFDFQTWDELAAQRLRSEEARAEGLMLKRANAAYPGGRTKGVWWKWKVDPLTVDAVLIYAQRGSGKRASLYTDYTFGVWDGDVLVPFAKAYSGLSDREIAEVDAIVRRSTKEKFGPVRTVEPTLVFELGFEGIQFSKRHKSGIAVRFPRILRWRRDKTPADADRLETVKALIGGESA